MATKTLVFSVTVSKPMLVTPSRPTPYEIKPLSDIDDQEGFRFQIPVIQFYRKDPKMDGRDPARVVRDALSEALVYYYPFAGRLIEGENKKLSVECSGEGVLFVEGDADVSLEEFGDALKPPFPCWEKLLMHVPGSDGVIGCPLLLIQCSKIRFGQSTWILVEASYSVESKNSSSREHSYREREQLRFREWKHRIDGCPKLRRSGSAFR
ncbi:hypothetical protein AMTRI_Chr03g144220 [Amborella trichopoda]